MIMQLINTACSTACGLIAVTKSIWCNEKKESKKKEQEKKEKEESKATERNWEKVEDVIPQNSIGRERAQAEVVNLGESVNNTANILNRMS